MKSPTQTFIVFCLCVLFPWQASAACNDRVLHVHGRDRSEIICTPSKSTSPVPVVLVFHGRGGNAKDVAEGIRLHELWPEALVVYMEGLPGIPAPYDPEGRGAGWQLNAGEANDRDIAFTDATLDTLAQQFNVDQRHVFAVGHSNGASFIGVLWATRAQRFDGFAFSASQADQLITSADPKSVFMGMGMRDELIPFTQQRKSIQYATTRFGMAPVRADQPGVNLYRNKNGIELMTAIYTSGHTWPAEQSQLIVDFFKRQLQK